MTKVKSILLTALMLLGLINVKAQTLNTADQLAVINAVSQWNQLQDDVNIAAFMDLWISDASFENPFGKFDGKAAIQQFVEGYVAGFAKGKRHQSSNITISGNGKRASVIEDLNVVEVNDIPYIAATVRLTATLIKVGDDWKFQTVKLAIDPGFNKLIEKMNVGN